MFLLISASGDSEAMEVDISNSPNNPTTDLTGPTESSQTQTAAVPGTNIAPPALLQFAKTRKLSVERSNPRKYYYYYFFLLNIYLLLYLNFNPLFFFFQPSSVAETEILSLS